MRRFVIRAAHQIRKTGTDLRFNPGWDTAVAVVTLLLFWPIYYIGANVDTVSALLVFLIGGNLFINVLLPV